MSPATAAKNASAPLSADARRNDSGPDEAGMIPIVGRYRLRLAVRCLDAGGIVAYPTEAVYGLGCDPWNAGAVRRLLAAKCRQEGKGLIVIGADFSQLASLVEPLDPVRMTDIFTTWPGPVTWLLPARRQTPRWLTGDHATLAVRVTAHPLAAALCRAWGGPLVSTSANRSDLPPARTAPEVRLHLGRAVDFILSASCGGRSRPSTIRDGCSGAIARP